jgi:hypothetical protein
MSGALPFIIVRSKGGYLEYMVEALNTKGNGKNTRDMYKIYDVVDSVLSFKCHYFFCS